MSAAAPPIPSPAVPTRKKGDEEEEREALNALLTPTAKRAIEDFCEDLGSSVTAMLEALGRWLAEGNRPDEGLENALRRDARRITAARRKGRRV